MRKATESHQGIPAGLLLSWGLQAFLVACRTGSLSAAARETGVTPSAVSQTITRLEAELGVELFDRSKRPLAPTADGRLLYESLQSHLSALTGTLQAVQTRNFIKPAVRIGLIESLGRNVCPELISRLLENGRRPYIHTGTSAQLHARLAAGDLDLIVAASPGTGSGNFDRRFLLSEPHVVLLPRGAGKPRGEWRWSDLALSGIPLVRFTRDTASGLLTESVLEQAGVRIPFHIAVDDNHIVFSAVRDGLGWTLTNPLSLLPMIEELSGRCEILPAPKPCPAREIWIVRRRESSRLLMEETASLCREILLGSVLPRALRHMPWLGEEMTVCTKPLTGRQRIPPLTPG